ncbi:hypothetical protein Y717_28735 [Streptomyces scopuliridis RB72]|uniref:DUF3492 domain-containing protein n=1 Tax=Streptomyces scopuliridis RB72 TaxID=1440053 RepID=A0A2T7T414_9ACTN|nr:hypothetical protein Y717_28735 [Streptomyces scopuliridis RB72]
MLVRIGLLTDGGYPYATGESRLWCDRLVRGLAPHEFDLYALSRSAGQESRGWIELPPRVRQVRTAPLWGPAEDGRGYGRRDRRRFAAHFTELTASVRTARGDDATASDRFGAGLYGLGPVRRNFAGPRRSTGQDLADLARERGGLPTALRSEAAVRLLEAACRTPGARRSVHTASVADLLALADQLERALRPLSLDWYGDDGLAGADLCHAASGGPAALPGLLAKRFFGVPLLVTEYGVRLRAHYLAGGGAPRADAPGDAPGGVNNAPVRALFAAFQGRPAAEVYRQAGVITSGNGWTGGLSGLPRRTPSWASPAARAERAERVECAGPVGAYAGAGERDV